MYQKKNDNENMTNFDNELYHYGILGMKWGKRKNGPNALQKLHANRLKKISDGTAKDAEDLRKHGYIEEADAVQQVADKWLSKYDKAMAKYNGIASKEKMQQPKGAMNDGFNPKLSTDAMISKTKKLPDTVGALKKNVKNKGQEYVNKIFKK